MGKTTKVVVCGMKGVGKTSILEQLIYGNVTRITEFYPTIEDIYVAHIETDRGTREKVRFYDTSGVDPNNRELPQQYLTFADGYVLVYDTDRPESFNFALGLKKYIDKSRDKKEVTIIVLGNRMDTGEENKVDSTQVANWASREKVKQYEVNALDRSSLYDPFVYLASKLNPPPNKSSFPQLSMVRKTKDTS